MPSDQRNRRNDLRLRLLRVAGRALATRPRRATGRPARVLLLRPDHVGDVLLTAPAVALLRASLPDARLDYVVGPWSADAARHGPRVDSVRPLAYPGFTRRRNANLVAPYALLFREAAMLRHERYDLAVVFRPDHWWGALLALAAGVPVRVGGLTAETAPVLTHTYAAPPSEHAAEQSLSMAHLALQACGAPPVDPPDSAMFAVPERARAAADDFWTRYALEGRTVVGIHPGAGAPLKSWPIEHWAQVVDGLLSDGLEVVLVGAPHDGPQLAAIRTRVAHGPVAVACGQSLEVSAALYQRCALVIAVDSGAAHLTAAVGTPTVRLYGPAPSHTFGPWPRRADQHVLLTRRLACVPCGNLESPPCGARALPACMLALGVDDVLNVARAQLARV